MGFNVTILAQYNKFKTFTQLEQSVACGACEEAGKHIANKLTEIFTGNL